MLRPPLAALTRLFAGLVILVDKDLTRASAHARARPSPYTSADAALHPISSSRTNGLVLHQSFVPSSHRTLRGGHHFGPKACPEKLYTGGIPATPRLGASAQAVVIQAEAPRGQVQAEKAGSNRI